MISLANYGGQLAAIQQIKAKQNGHRFRWEISRYDKAAETVPGRNAVRYGGKRWMQASATRKYQRLSANNIQASSTK